MSIMAINVDRIIESNMIDKISQIDGVHQPKYIKLTSGYTL